MMGLSDDRKSFPIGLAVLIQYRSVTATQPTSHVAVAITLNAKASSLKIALSHSAVSRRAVNRETQGSGLPKTQSLISYIAYTSWRLNKNVQNSGKTGKEHVSPSQLFSSSGLQIQPTYFEDTA